MRSIVLFALFGCRTEKAATIVDTDLNDVDADGYVDEDCDDNNSAINPGADEICDGIDNNCDGNIDEGVRTDFFADSDEDGFGDPAISIQACEVPDGFVENGSDCDDNSDLSYPGAEEICDGLDNDCNGEIDEGLDISFFVDADEDGFGDDDQVVQGCQPAFGLSQIGGDCNDDDASISPIANELCDGVDNNCNGTFDEGVTTTYYNDVDGDGFGDDEQSLEACEAPEGYVLIGGDCNDVDTQVFPDASEVCDGQDNNCDGISDENSALDTETFYLDADEDGFGDPANTIAACERPSGYALFDTDCDDGEPSVYPGASETCNGRDDNCDDEIDEDSAIDALLWYADSDDDGYGDPNHPHLSCTLQNGYSADNGDCNDNDEDSYPGASEYCNAKDDDCDGDIDESDAVNASTYYEDLDEDDYGNPNTSMQSCTLPAGYVEDNTDCDDGDALVRPTAIEICDGIDNNCDGDIDEDDSSLSDALLWFLDHDGDGEGDADFMLSLCAQPTGYVDNSNDCNDLNASISSRASEVCDGLDNNCDGLIDDDDPAVVSLVTYYLDLDADGYGDASQTQASCAQPNGYVGDDTDCDDNEAAINPLAVEVCDGLDNDCDGAFDDDDTDVDLTTGNAYYTDADLDGYGNPSLIEERCALTTGYSELDTDCDDADPDTNPDAVEQCDAVDNDCDGGIDDGTLGSSTACGATSCAEIAQSYTTSSGVYWIDIPSQGVSQVYCDMDVDGGGWTLIEWLDHGFHLSSAASNLSSLFDRSVPAKMSDSDIVSLATAGQNEVMISDGSSTYVLRYSDAEWGSFSSSGWTNVVYDSKGSNGSWSDDICNGHFNNRGFSTYSDSDGSACPIVYSGASKYYSTYHTSLYSTGVGGAFGVYVR